MTLSQNIKAERLVKSEPNGSFRIGFLLGVSIAFAVAFFIGAL